MRILALDAMGVIYRAGDDVAQLLIPFVRKRSNADVARIEELYHRCSLGEFSSASFWEQLGLAPAVEDEYLGGHRLVEGVGEFIAEAAELFDAVWCLSNDVSEWSIKLRELFSIDQLFDGCVISGDVKARKPSAEIYGALCALACVRPQDVLFIDDRSKNVIAAKDYGFEAILFGEQPGPVRGLPHAQDFSELRSMVAGAPARPQP